MDKMKGWKENVWWISWSVFTLLQVILAFFLCNPDGLKGLFYLGWIILAVGFTIGYMGVSTLCLPSALRKLEMKKMRNREHPRGHSETLQLQTNSGEVIGRDEEKKYSPKSLRRNINIIWRNSSIMKKRHGGGRTLIPYVTRGGVKLSA